MGYNPFTLGERKMEEEELEQRKELASIPSVETDEADNVF